MEDLLLMNCLLYNSKDEESVDILIKQGKIFQLGKIANVDGNTCQLELNGRIVTPGFIDIHIQGAGGADILEGTLASLQTISRTLARFGTTGFLATTVIQANQENPHLELAAKWTGKDLGGAHLLGIHVEGPFVNPIKRGGISIDNISNPSLKALEDILDITGSSLKMMTIAPELNNVIDLIHRLVNSGVIASFGHSNATYEETKIGIEAGISHVTHIFNAMPPLHHRIPGPIPAIFESRNVSAQIIADGVHLHPSIVNLIYEGLGSERSVCITDGLPAIGLPEGNYLYNQREYEAKDGVARYLDGTLIGTALALDQIVMRFKTFTHCSLETAIDTISQNPARILGLEDRKGAIKVNHDADLVILDHDYSVWATIINGKIVYQKG